VPSLILIAHLLLTFLIHEFVRHNFILNVNYRCPGSIWFSLIFTNTARICASESVQELNTANAILCHIVGIIGEYGFVLFWIVSQSIHHQVVTGHIHRYDRVCLHLPACLFRVRLQNCGLCTLSNNTNRYVTIGLGETSE
jgi:hypothetical protein